MLKKLLVTSLASISLAMAGTLTLDDFSVDSGVLTATGSSTQGDRTLALTTLGSVAPPIYTTAISGGALDINNGSGDDAQVVLSYNLGAALAIPVGATNLQITLLVNDSDANPISVTMGGIAGGAFAIGGGFTGTVTGALAGPPVGPGLITFTFDGEPGWDLNIDQLGISWDDPVTVPEPGTYAMIGLGLAGLAFLRRK